MMSLLLPSILAESARTKRPFVLLQSSIAQSGLPILRHFINRRDEGNVAKRRSRVLLFCVLHPSSSLVDPDVADSQTVELQTFDLTDNVPGYNDTWRDPRDMILDAVRDAPQVPLDVIIDSVDTLITDIGSVSQTYAFLRKLLSSIQERTDPCRLTLHILSPSDILPLLIHPSFSPSLTHLTAYAPAILTHLSTAYLTPPPPLSAPAKFWGVFLPLSERGYESDRLVFGVNGTGCSNVEEMVVDVVVRGDGGKRRGVERVLEGWSAAKGGCELVALDSLKSLWATKKTVDDAAPDPTQNVSFNLNLTPSQQQSRAQVPLPYAHEGKPVEKSPSTAPAAIFYDPDSADDIDDDDPDEDLDI